ncbi:DUF4064 domain-containing protein [Listeria monocytogenes]|uniref:DUF4064 domain-containing protein n=1 Tax=Listeria monocytogenes serotype 4a (strain M7) TaxID=1030009 RepID=A0A0E0UU00_LISMM|nr:DUF4064 domain-containing protein [Listeria monocytogenes]MCY61562.1 DUF4064 domain-containing protein [Listeria monocytogenes serotype 4c]ACK40571.1 conserved hypothetical protein [Listeria monocytogenes HCC23]AEH91435.1 hypothetical protein LMM7_0429 [Listeria monocytogenes M7]AKS53016.1 2'-O-methyl transferase [Listeria monocytogenes]EAA0348525.1 DUF4064 domain-containing protein [Listeria monocytogenes]
MNRQTEFTLLIVGASLSILVFLGAVFYSLIFGVNTLMVTDTFGYYSSSEEAIVLGIITFFSIIAAFFALLSAVFGFIGAFKIKSNGPKAKQLGVCFIILGGLQVFTIHGILFLIAGILTVTKKEYKTISKEDEGTKWE